MYLKKISKKNIISSGIYLLNKKILNDKEFLKKDKIDLDKDIIWPFLKANKIAGKIYDEHFVDIGEGVKEFKLSKNKISKILKKPCCFLDRDGVINHDYGYVGKINKFKWKQGVKKAIQYLNENNYYVIVITNQAGIAYGYYGEKDFYKLNYFIRDELNKKNSYFDKIYFCPYHERAKIKKYKRKTILRKPGIGMLNNAFKDFQIIKNKSFFIGDKSSDELCAKNFGIKYYKSTNNLYNQITKIIN